MNSFLDLQFLGVSPMIFDTLRSTNDYLKEIVSNQIVKEGQMVIALQQTAGRGQIGNSWHASYNENLLFSMYLNPKIHSLEDIFFLNKFIAISIVNSIQNELSENKINDTCFIKWPNDIIINNKKIGGILIENSLRGTHIESSIVGIGLNICETDFPIELTKAASLATLYPNIEWDKKKILSKILIDLEQNYSIFQEDYHYFNTKQYESLMYKKDALSQFKIQHQTLEGIIKGINQLGQLLVEVRDQVNKYNFKEIELIY